MSNLKIKATVAAAKAAGISFYYHPQRRTISVGSKSYSVEQGIAVLQSALADREAGYKKLDKIVKKHAKVIGVPPSVFGAKPRGGARAGAGRPKGAARIHVSLRRDLHPRIAAYGKKRLKCAPLTEALDHIVERFLSNQQTKS